MRSQASLDFLFVIALGLIIVFSFYTYAYRMSNDEISTKKAELALGEIKKAANEVYSLNPGSSEKVKVSLPKNIVNYTIKNNEICYVLSLGSGIDYVCVTTNANLTGKLPVTPGEHFLLVSYVNGGVEIH